MAYQALYRAWRPQRFSEIAGQRHITRTLVNAVDSGRIAHAYLFSGPRGTGKTTTAKVLAKAVNCAERDGAEPCNRCPNCTATNNGVSVDVLEIDAASNRGIDEIRELREQVRYRPASAPYKVFIVDEVHMLTGEAFNALLKTLEEPPQHVIFILATTEAHKVPLTILSRCQRFEFRRISNEEIIERLDEIIQSGSLSVDDGVPELIARVSEGSLRDALSVLDQASALGGDRITMDDLYAILGTVGQDTMETLARLLDANDAAGALRLLHEVENSKDLRLFAREFSDYLRGRLFATLDGRTNPKLDQDRVLRLLSLFAKAEQEMRFASRLSLPLELAIVRFVRGDDDLETRVADLEQRLAKLEERPGTAPPESVAGEVQVRISAPPPNVLQTTPAQETQPSGELPVASERDRRTVQEPVSAAQAVDFDAVCRRWPEVLASCKRQQYLKRTRLLALNGMTLVVGCADPFTLNVFERPENLAALDEALHRVLGVKWRIKCVRDNAPGEP
ncbi:MAG: DNA polymerase III subunit gamma/tau [Candidatus Desulforudaceae bacterium]